jgi:endonuclease YncB( thermonuclease family)
MKLMVGMVLMVLLCGACTKAQTTGFSGMVTVVDGDTVHMRDLKFRFHGIDAPESSQLCQDMAGKDYRCGQVSANALDAKIAGRTVTCEEHDRDRYGRIVAVCKVAGEDLNRWMVQSGLALAYTQYSKDYVSDEQTAKAQKVGLWAGTFENPADYRKTKKNSAKTPTNRTPRAQILASVPNNVPSSVPTNLPNGSSAGVGVAPDANGECPTSAPLKGSGGKKYHHPGGRYYAKTKAKVCFASEADAQGAGFVMAKGQ